MHSDPLVTRHLDHLRQLGRSPRTIEQRQRTLALIERYIDVPLIEATREQLAAWRRDLKCGDLTIAAYLSDARQYYAWLADEGLRADNPAARLPGPKRGRLLPRPIGEDDLFRALALAPRRIRPMLALAGWAGLRSKEIARLRRRCVADTAQPPYVFIARGATKGTSERIVPIGGTVYDELLAYGLPRAGSAWVFPRLDGGRGPLTSHRVSILCNEYLHELGIDATLHQLRHRFASKLLEETDNTRLVQEALGHASLESTQIYTLVTPARMAAAVAALPSPRRLRAM